MATITRPVRSFSVFGNRRAFIGQYTGPASYPTGGDAFAPKEVGLGEIEYLIIENAVNAGGTVRIPQYDHSNELLRWIVPNTGAEVGDTTDLSGYNARFIAIGK